MPFYESILGQDPKKAFTDWLELLQEPRKTQESTLLEILDMAKDTEWGRRYDFASISSIEDYQARLPITSFSDIACDCDRIAEGATDILFQGAPDAMITTTGTTGKPKLLPETFVSYKTKESIVRLRDLHSLQVIIPNIATNPRFQALVKELGLDPTAVDLPKFISKVKFFAAMSQPIATQTSAGIRIGFASGEAVAQSGYSRQVSFPIEVLRVRDAHADQYLKMRFSIEEKLVSLMQFNLPILYVKLIDFAKQHAQEIISDIKEGTISDRISLTQEERSWFDRYLAPNPTRAAELQEILDRGIDEFVPVNYWPYLLSARFWIGGSLGTYVPQARAYLSPDTLVFDAGYGATEARINIPFMPDSPYGIPAIASVFFEFRDVQTGEIFTIDQVKENTDYEILLTTYAGLYRYDIKDVVRFKGTYQGVSCLAFITKAGEYLSVMQEKIPAVSVAEITRDVIQTHDNRLTCMQIVPNSVERRYDLYIELAKKPDQSSELVQELAEQINTALCNHFESYAARINTHTMTSVTVTVMKSGWQDFLMSERIAQGTGSVSQIKLKLVVETPPVTEWQL